MLAFKNRHPEEKSNGISIIGHLACFQQLSVVKVLAFFFICISNPFVFHFEPIGKTSQTIKNNNI